jgi:Calx-beta domain
MNLKHTLILTLSLLSLTAAQATAPANDRIENAIKLSGNYNKITSQDLTLATADVMDPLLSGASAGKTLWYAFPYFPAVGTLQFTISSTTAVGSATIFIALDRDNPRGSLRQVNTSAITNGQTMTISTAFNGQPLYLMLAGTGQCGVTQRLESTLYDFPASARALTGNFGSVSLNNETATNTADEPALPSGASSMTNIIWCKWTPTVTGQVSFDTNFSYPSGSPVYPGTFEPTLHQTQIALYLSTSGGSSESLVPLTYDDSSGYGTINSRLSSLLVSGNTYYIAIGTRNGESGHIRLQYYRHNTPSQIYFESNIVGASSEGGGSQLIIIRRRYASYSTASCTLATSNDSATAGSDYTSLSTTINFTNPDVWSDGQTPWQTKVFVPLTQDSLVEAQYERVNVALSNISVGSIFGNISSAYFDILDDEIGSTGFLQHPVSLFRIRENGGKLHIPVIRKSVGVNDFIELYQTWIEGSATSPEDFSITYSYLYADETSTTLYFEPMNDDVFEGEKWAKVRVSGVMGTYTVVIEDDDPYIPVAGRLTTSVGYANGTRQAVLYGTVSSLGVISGKLNLVGQSLPFTGKFDSRGKFETLLAPKGRSTLHLTLAAQDHLGHVKVSLIDSATNNSQSAEAMIQNFGTTNPCPLAGLFTVNTNVAQSDGSNPVFCLYAASCKVGVSGTAIFTGRLFDGTAFTASGYVDGEAQVAASATLYRGLGFIGFRGEMPLTAGTTNTLTTALNRPARANDPAKFGAVAVATFGNCVRYTPPAAGTQIIEAWAGGTGKATLEGKPLANNLTKALTISTKNVIATPLDAVKLKLSVVPATGMFSGSFVLPGTTKVLPIFGALSDLPGMNGIGRGFFFDGKSGGLITLGNP